MPTKRVLVQWVGHSDLNALAATLPEGEADEILTRTRGKLPQDGDLGPTKTLLTNESFDEVHLLANYEPKWMEKYVAWLPVDAMVDKVDIEKVTDYPSVLAIADKKLRSLKERGDWEDIQLVLHLSPGTPTMTAIWLLLGKTRYPASFYQSYRGKSESVDLPFDLTLDIVSEMLRRPDAYLQHLTAQSPAEVEGFEDIVGDSQAIRDAVGRARRTSIRSVSVLLLGESGTGKEMFARAIYKASPRRDKPFIAINCAALSKSLLESELFGHVAGAFTGADRDRKGAFELAHGGTIFLDEVGECDLETQAKLLRVLQPVSGEGPSIRTVRRLMDEKESKFDVRLIAATNRDLHKAIREGDFREDLFNRMATITITLPPLRNRKSDIEDIAIRLMDQVNKLFAAEDPTGYQPKKLLPDAISFVRRHDWPGNVRQLYNALVQAVVLGDSDELSEHDLRSSLAEIPRTTPLTMQPLGDGFVLKKHLTAIERQYLRRAMNEAGGNKAEAARLLGLKSQQNMSSKLKTHNLQDGWELDE